MPTHTGGGYALITAIPRQDPSNPAVGRTIDRLRAELPSGSLIGGAVAENHDLQAALSARTPLVIAVVLALGFVLLLIALQAPLLAAVGVVTNLLATGAAFLLSAAKEHWDHTHDAREAMVGGVAHSGRVIFAAGAVIVAVFFTFALSGPLPPKEMGIILGVAVLLDAALIRLLLLPVLLRLMGRWAWYLPRWAHRVLPDVTFGHA
jgi:RND superfamily putative drug exporter